jgi:hypothetical protein
MTLVGGAAQSEQPPLAPQAPPAPHAPLAAPYAAFPPPVPAGAPGGPPLDPNLAPYAAWDPARQAAWVTALAGYRYSSIDDWSTRVWAEGHTYTLEYPDAPSEAARAAAAAYFKTAFASRIRCGNCRMHYDAAAAKVDEHTVSRAALVAWFIRIHNMVNAKTGRPTLTPEDALARYMAPSALAAAIRGALSGSASSAAPLPVHQTGPELNYTWVALILLIVCVAIAAAWYGITKLRSARAAAPTTGSSLGAVAPLRVRQLVTTRATSAPRA